jgi:hypothetical protein
LLIKYMLNQGLKDLLRIVSRKPNPGPIGTLGPLLDEK